MLGLLRLTSLLNNRTRWGVPADLTAKGCTFEFGVALRSAVHKPFALNLAMFRVLTTWQEVRVNLVRVPTTPTVFCVKRIHSCLHGGKGPVGCGARALG